MLFPYGRRPPPRDPCLVDRWVGTGWRLVERHEIHVRARPAAALEAFAALRIRDLPPVRVLFALRGLRTSPDTSLGEFFSTPPFVLVDAEPGRELVGGIMLPPRDPSGRRRPPLTPYAFRAALREAPLAAVATFRAEAAAGGARLWTETWVRTSGAVAGAAFGAYWLVIGPWSAWIRRLFLRAARARAEAAERPPRAAP